MHIGFKQGKDSWRMRLCMDAIFLATIVEAEVKLSRLRGSPRPVVQIKWVRLAWDESDSEQDK